MYDVVSSWSHKLRRLCIKIVFSELIAIGLAIGKNKQFASVITGRFEGTTAQYALIFQRIG